MLKKVEQISKTIEEFAQEFKWVTWDNKYKEQVLIENFKREINKVIKRKLIEVEWSLRSINQ